MLKIYENSRIRILVLYNLSLLCDSVRTAQNTLLCCPRVGLFVGRNVRFKVRCYVRINY